MVDYKWLEQKSNELLQAHVRLRDAVNRATRAPNETLPASAVEMQEFEHARATYLRIHKEWLDLIGQSV